MTDFLLLSADFPLDRDQLAMWGPPPPAQCQSVLGLTVSMPKPEIPGYQIGLIGMATRKMSTQPDVASLLSVDTALAGGPRFRARAAMPR